MKVLLRPVWKKGEALGVALLLHALFFPLLWVKPTMVSPKPVVTHQVALVPWAKVAQMRREPPSNTHPAVVAHHTHPAIVSATQPSTVSPKPTPAPPIMTTPRASKPDLTPHIMATRPTPDLAPPIMATRPTPDPLRRIMATPRPSKPDPAPPRMMTITLPRTQEISPQHRVSSDPPATPQPIRHNTLLTREGKPSTPHTTGTSDLFVPPRTDATYQSNPKPVYPARARQRGLQGVVILSVEVDISGRPLDVTIKQGSGHAVLDRSALLAVQRWRFVPARRGNTPVRATVNVPIRFQLMEG